MSLDVETLQLQDLLDVVRQVFFSISVQNGDARRILGGNNGCNKTRIVSGDHVAERPDGMKGTEAVQRAPRHAPAVSPAQSALSGAVSLTYLAPPPDLADKFGALYHFIADKAEVEDHTRAELAQLRFMLSGTGHYIFGDGRQVETPRLCLLGPTNMATRFRVAGPLRVLGIGILPLGWIALRLGDASELAENLADIGQRLGKAGRELMADLQRINDIEEAAPLVWQLLRDAVTPPQSTQLAFVNATDAWLTGANSPRIEDLQIATGLSARQISRLCNRYYGASPKYLARKYRALRCAQAIAIDQLEWTDCCGDAFYDQSHFIREIKHFIGMTPNQLRGNASLVMRLTMGRRDVADLAALSRMG